MSPIEKITALLACLAMTGCASTDTWTRSDTIGESLVVASLAIDAYQTSRIQHMPGHYECGWARTFLGSQPSTQGTAMYFGTIAISHALIARALPASWRKYWQGGLLAVQVPTVLSNYQVQKR